MPAKYFSLLPLLRREQRPPLDKRATRKGEAPPPPTPRPREQTQAGDQSLSLSPDLVGTANWVKARKKPWVFCADPTRPSESVMFPKRPSNPCPGCPQRGAAASEASTEPEADPSWHLWPIQPQQRARLPSVVFGVRFHLNKGFYCQKKKLEATVYWRENGNLESDLAL